MKNVINYILVFSIMCLWQLHTHAQVESVKKEIDKIIKYDTQLMIDDNPGFIISVIDQDSIYFIPYGTIENESNAMPSPDDIYEIGSITKSFSALLTLALEERGLLSLEDPVNIHLHPNYQNPRLSELTIHDLLIHTSGFPKRPDLFGRKMKDAQNPYKYYTKHDLLQYYSGYVVEDKPSFEYAHTNYALLEIVLENATGKSYAELLHKYLWTPMDMQSSYVGRHQEQTSTTTPGYDKASRLTQAWDFESFAASEGIRSSSIDLCKYIQFQMDDESKSSLTHAINSCQEVQIPNSLNNAISSAYGWQIYKRDKKGYPIYTFTGRTSGHNAFISFVKETKTAVIILSNSIHGTEDLGLQVLRMINYNWKRKV